MGRPYNPLSAELTRFHRARTQARYRREEWQLTFKEWLDLWHGQLDQCGRDGESLSLHRKDTTQGWDADNVEITKRKTYLGRRA